MGKDHVTPSVGSASERSCDVRAAMTYVCTNGRRGQPDRETEGNRCTETSRDGKPRSQRQRDKQTEIQTNGSLGAIGHSDPHGPTKVPSPWVS